jgi:hypothetical protein
MGVGIYYFYHRFELKAFEGRHKWHPGYVPYLPYPRYATDQKYGVFSVDMLLFSMNLKKNVLYFYHFSLQN